ncbi:MAG: phosphatidate cytidylyltransferase [Pseudopedobacter saltans]|uniref:Phosphatidate cytidylyltransferase n=1 Tax=Pseudopedobacter saltans TaxID=151895 RepID=A0A2W5F603_9SPHI|nr:MAG: phosphatidate cytidylyltransferase [Pseudopedobacter saltans]
MAFNVATFKTRALTAIIFVLVMLAGLLINNWTLLILFVVVHFGCWYEFQKLAGEIDPRYKEVDSNVKMSGSLAGLGFILWNTQLMDIGSLPMRRFGFWIMLLGIAYAFISMLIEPSYKKGVLKYTGLGWLYVSISWGCFISLSQWSYEGYPFIVLTLIASIWLNDTLAYIVGSFIGKTPFSKISPKKTWEGTIGGAILAVVLVTCIGYFAINKGFLQMYIVVSAIAAVFGTLGDLLESKIKRMANVKDSGTIMPGHGGFLDRFDSLMVASVAVWLYIFIGTLIK